MVIIPPPPAIESIMPAIKAAAMRSSVSWSKNSNMMQAEERMQWLGGILLHNLLDLSLQLKKSLFCGKMLANTGWEMAKQWLMKSFKRDDDNG
ncbi:hypothetical protein ACLBWZ_17075 [Brucellaceae bacterium C25G]